MELEKFIQLYLQSSRQFMWFLGAGTSRSSGMPSANDIIWDLKLRIFSQRQNQNIDSLKIGNPSIQRKIQLYFDSLNYPILGSPEEYSFYFKEYFGDNRLTQQQFIANILKIESSLSVGPKVLAALMKIGLAKVVYTTNFDSILENAFAEVARQSIDPFHIEGSYATLEALNNEEFPIYVKLHGDFKFQSIMNLAEDLLNNERQLKQAFLASATRFGLIVAGYSGRDTNVMNMLHEAVSQNNAFPKGIIWATQSIENVEKPVKSFIDYAQSKGIQAHLLKVGTFDLMMTRIWKQIENKPNEISQRIHLGEYERPIILQRSEVDNESPILRTNLLPIHSLPNCVGTCISRQVSSYKELNLIKENNVHSNIFSYSDKILFWGESASVQKMLQESSLEFQRLLFDDVVKELERSKNILAMYTEALAKALANGKPLAVRKDKHQNYFLIAKTSANESFNLNQFFLPLTSSIGNQNLSGLVPQLPDVTWYEAIRVKIEIKDGNAWLCITPDIWITPLSKREEQQARNLIRSKTISRYNNVSNGILSGWIKILLGEIKSTNPVSIGFGGESDYPARFEISSRTAFSRRVK